MFKGHQMRREKRRLKTKHGKKSVAGIGVAGGSHHVKNPPGKEFAELQTKKKIQLERGGGGLTSSRPFSRAHLGAEKTRGYKKEAKGGECQISGRKERETGCPPKLSSSRNSGACGLGKGLKVAQEEALGKHIFGNTRESLL